MINCGPIAFSSLMVGGIIGSKIPPVRRSPQQCIYGIDAGKFLSVTNRIDGTRMAAAGQHHESFVPHINHQRLVVMDERIGLPLAIDL